MLSPDVSQGLSQQGPDGSSHSIASYVGSFGQLQVAPTISLAGEEGDLRVNN